ncbi:hypothetical protein ACOMDP_12350 [Pantoea dispersa]|uniref:hypothetical protein n=1 Tax=Pantoea dispersa TaxID=59814 RepID=UPI003B7C7399
MPKVDRSSLTPEELDILRKKERGYKKKSRKKRGLIEVPVNREMLSMIQKVSHSLSLSAPTSSTHGRMTTISQVFEYLLKKETESEFYKIKKAVPKSLFRLHTTVLYLKNVKRMGEEEIANFMTETGQLTPKAIFEGSNAQVWFKKTVQNLLDERKVYDKIHKLNDE